MARHIGLGVVPSIAPGVGLAARVVRTRAPQWAARYDTAEVPHTAGIDDAVAGEGLAALLGVPMIAGGGETLGVLFAANHYEDGFRPDQVALLSAFADHAAVVLETARLLAQSTAAETEVRHARDRLADHVEAMERSLHLAARRRGATGRPDRRPDRVRDALAAGRRTGREVLAVDAPPVERLDELASRFGSARRCVLLLSHLGVRAGAVSTVPYLPYESRARRHRPRHRHRVHRCAHRPGRALGHPPRHRPRRDDAPLPRRAVQPDPAARALRVHTDAVLQRVERIDMLLGDDWKEGDKRFRIGLVVRLHRLADAAGQP